MIKLTVRDSSVCLYYLFVSGCSGNLTVITLPSGSVVNSCTLYRLYVHVGDVDVVIGA